MSQKYEAQCGQRRNLLLTAGQHAALLLCLASDDTAHFDTRVSWVISFSSALLWWRLATAVAVTVTHSAATCHDDSFHALQTWLSTCKISSTSSCSRWNGLYWAQHETKTLLDTVLSVYWQRGIAQSDKVPTSSHSPNTGFFGILWWTAAWSKRH